LILKGSLAFSVGCYIALLQKGRAWQDILRGAEASGGHV